MATTDPKDFDNAADESGEAAVIYNQTEEISEDYGSLISQDLGAGTSENAIIQPETEYRAMASEGRIHQGDLFAMFKSSSVATKDSLITFNSKMYKIKNFIDIRPGGTIHHYEANLEFVRNL